MENAQNFNVNTSFGFLLGRSAKCMAEHLHEHFTNAELHISMSHWIILSQLWHEDGLSQQEISNRTGVAKPNVTTMVDMLEKNSYIVRIPDQIDRRINRIFLTQKGKDMRVPAVRQALSVYEIAFADFSTEERIQFLALLAKVFRNLQTVEAGVYSCGE